MVHLVDDKLHKASKYTMTSSPVSTHFPRQIPPEMFLKFREYQKPQTQKSIS